MKKNKTTKVQESTVFYGDRIVISTNEALEEQTRQKTADMSHEERLEYLQKLRSITHDLNTANTSQPYKLGKLRIRKPNENS